MLEMQYKIKPYEWQLQLFEMSMRHRNLAVLADMGTGKSGATVNVLRGQYTMAKRVKKTLIISPLVTLFNWKNEFSIHSTVPENRIHVLHGTSVQKMKTFNKAIEDNPCQIIIMNYEAVLSETIWKALMEWSPEILILDEAHYVKNHKAKRSKLIHAIAGKADNRYLLTGTPIANRITDIFMLFKILDGGETFGTNFYAFQRKYMYDENQAWAHSQKYFPKWVPIPEMLDDLQSKIYEKGIRVMKKDCMDLPPRIQEVYPVELSPKQRKAYDEMERDYLTYVEDAKAKGVSVATTALTKALRLQQIVTGFVIDDEGKVIEFDDCPRLDALEELILSLHENHKVIVWCSFVNNYKRIGQMLDHKKIKHVFITGDESLEEKEANMKVFNQQDSGVQIAVCNRRAAGIGVNLVGADYSITYSRNYSLTEELQSQDRNYRGGSQIHEKITKIDLCARKTVDEVVTEALINKHEIANKVIDIVKQRRNHV